MDHFTYETVERLESFATFLENYKGRIMDVRGPARRTAHTQIETWGYIETELSGRLKDQGEALEQSADASRVNAGSRLYASLTSHVSELDRLVTGLRSQITEAQGLEQQLLTADRGVEEIENSQIDAGVANLRHYASAIREYLDVMSRGY